MYLQFKIWLIRKIRLTDTQFLYIVNITTKIPNFNTEYQAMSLQCRKSFQFENSKFSNCLPCAKKKHMAKCLVYRMPSCSTRRSWVPSTSVAPPSTSVCHLRTWVARARGLPCVLTVAHGKVVRPSTSVAPPSTSVRQSARECHVHEVCRVFWGRHTAKIVICRVFGFCCVFLGLAHGKEAILPCAWGLPCVLFWAHGKVAVCRVPIF